MLMAAETSEVVVNVYAPATCVLAIATCWIAPGDSAELDAPWCVDEAAQNGRAVTVHDSGGNRGGGMRRPQTDQQADHRCNGGDDEAAPNGDVDTGDVDSVNLRW